MLLAGDIGGTKSRLGIFSASEGARHPLFEKTYRNADFSDLEAVLEDFLSRAPFTVRRACLGVAGPVSQGQSQMTNLPWIIDEVQLRDVLHLRAVHVINDLQAIAGAIPLLTPPDILTLNRGLPVERGNLAVLAPGTGLGEGFSVWGGLGYKSYASEGGHADFAPNSAMENMLLRALQKEGRHVSWETVCSGPGLWRIYRFLRDYGFGEEPLWLAEKLRQASHQTPVIVDAAMNAESRCDLCKRALDLFVTLLGAEAGNLALKILATGGLYLAGGIPPRIRPFLEKGRFMEAFQRKGRLSNLMARIPVHVILYPGAALMGAAGYGLQDLSV